MEKKLAQMRVEETFVPKINKKSSELKRSEKVEEILTADF